MLTWLSIGSGTRFLKSSKTTTRLFCEKLERPANEFRADYRQWRDHSYFSKVSIQQWDLLENLAQYLFEWNAKINLVSRKDIDQLIPNHIMPCLSMAIVRNFSNGERIIDVGTGGGLPGLPMAILCPQAEFTLVDSNTKKMMVVEDIATKLQLKNVRVLKIRAEEISDKYDFIFGRAVAAIPKFLGFSAHLLDPHSPSAQTIGPMGHNIGSGLLYLKGGDFTDELQEAGINKHTLFPVNELLPIDSDKNVLHIPAEEILAFQKRAIATKS
eukprot:gene12278-25817_t